MFIEQWESASRNSDTLVVGDTNLDFNKWRVPDSDHTYMVELGKDRMETQGFNQIIIGETRFWPGTPSSLLDQCWTNCGARIIKAANILKVISDHNMLELEIRIKGSGSANKEILTRDRS